MKTIRVQYTIKEEFAEQNKANIRAVMEELRGIGSTDTKYSSYVHEDGKTFMHVVQYKDGANESLPANLESFKHFQKELKENIEVPPKADTFGLVDASFELF